MDHVSNGEKDKSLVLVVGKLVIVRLVMVETHKMVNRFASKRALFLYLSQEKSLKNKLISRSFVCS